MKLFKFKKLQNLNSHWRGFIIMMIGLGLNYLGFFILHKWQLQFGFVIMMIGFLFGFIGFIVASHYWGSDEVVREYEEEREKLEPKQPWEYDSLEWRCPALDRVIDNGQCWEYCHAGRGGPADAKDEILNFIANSSKYSDLDDFHQACQNCENNIW